MNRHLLSLGLATASLLAAPLAFAQSANEHANMQHPNPATPAEPATPATPADPQQDTSAVPATPADPAQPGTKITWSELDADRDGALSKTEAAPVDSLSEAFDAADSDKDGSLTADEYKAYLANRQQSPTPEQPEQL